MIIKGDVNGDGRIDMLDVALVYLIALGEIEATPEMLIAADVDNDGEVTSGSDMWMIREHIWGLKTINEVIE